MTCLHNYLALLFVVLFLLCSFIRHSQLNDPKSAEKDEKTKRLDTSKNSSPAD